MLTFMSLGGFDTFRSFRWLLSPRAARPGARGGNSGSCINTKNQHVRRCGGQLHRLIGHTPHRKRAHKHDLTKQQSRHNHTPFSSGALPSFPRRRETTGWMCRGRHTGFKAVSTGRQGGTGEQDNTNHIPLSPLMGEESKVRVKTMTCIVLSLRT